MDEFFGVLIPGMLHMINPKGRKLYRLCENVNRDIFATENALITRTRGQSFRFLPIKNQMKQLSAR